MKFNIKRSDKQNYEIDATLLKNTPIKCFVHRGVTDYETEGWVVTEFFSGLRLTKAFPTRKSAIENVMFIFEEKGVELIKELVNNNVKRYGFANRDGTEKSSKDK